MDDKLSEQDAEQGQPLPAEVAELPTFKTMKPAKVSDKADLFCKWYALIHNGTAAYQRAGLRSTQPSRQVAKLMGREIIRTYIQALRTEILTGQAMGTVSPEWVTERYREIAQVRLPDLMVEDSVSGPRWKRLDELTDAQRAAIASIQLSTPKPRKSEDDSLPVPPSIVGYTLYPKPDALAALARFAGMNKDTVRHDHAHTVRGKVKGLFQFVAGNAPTSETVARLRARHGNAGARVIEHDSGVAEADQRTVRRLRGV